MKKILAIIVIFELLWAGSALAGSFGVSPPYVRNETLTKNSVYKQEIILVRGDPTEDVEANISINVPGANQWISIENGNKFILPKGKKQIPMTVVVALPDDVEFRRYKGNIRIRVSSKNIQEGQVGIELGAQIDVDLNVTDKEIFEFTIRRVKISDAEEGRFVWWLYFPGKISFTMELENTGNVPVAPTEVLFEVYDQAGNLLETTRNTNSIEEVPPFETRDVVAELPTRLSPGSYTVRYTIYNRDEIAHDGESHLSILSQGELEGYEGYGFIGLSFFHKVTVVGPILFVLLVFFYAVRRRFSRRAVQKI